MILEAILNKLVSLEWVKAGGIVGRGVLLDFARWQSRTGSPSKQVDAVSKISVKELQQVAEFQGTSFKPGDILIIRMGFTSWHDNAPEQERNQALDKGAFIGLENSMEMVKWLWNSHFAAIACDSLGLEACPVPFTDASQVCVHEWMLAHWGCPIGELWNLEELSKVCEEAGRWSFFFTSAPLHIHGGVGSPPNAIAVL